jgi:hypothetical protein
MRHIIYNNPFKEKILLLEKDFRNNIKKTFQVNDDIANFAHNIDDKLSVWIVDKLFTQLVKERHYIRIQIIEFLNTKSEDRDNYLKLFEDKVKYVLDYYNNPVGKQEYDTFDKFKKENFDTLYNKSDEWHKSLKGKSVKTVEIKDTEGGVEILKEYDPKASGEIYYWADLNKKNSEVERSRMGHCGLTSKGTTLLSLRSFYPNLDGTYTNKSHITLALNRDDKYYAQCKGKQNRKPAIQYTDYILDLFIFEPDIQDYNPEFVNSYLGTNDFKISDFSSSQMLKLHNKKPDLTKKFISPKFFDFENSLQTLNAKEIYSKYIENLNEEIIDEFSTRYSTESMIISQIIMLVLPIIIKDRLVFDELIKKYLRFEVAKEKIDKLDYEIQLTIVDYCIFSNNFAKIKSLFDSYLERNYNKQDNNIIYYFCYYAKVYPDYFTPYASKVIEPVIQKLVKQEISLLKIKELYNSEAIEIIKKSLTKDREKYKDTIFILHIDEIDNYIKSQNDEENTSSLIEFLDELKDKIEKSNSELKETSSDERFRKEIMSLPFFNKKSNFENIEILYLYKLNPNLIDYSYYSNFNPNIISKTILAYTYLEDVPLVYGGRYGAGEKIDIIETLESRDNFDIYVDSSEIEGYLDYIEGKEEDHYKKACNKIISAIEKETDRSYSSIKEEYDVDSISATIEVLNNESLIPDLYNTLERCAIYSYENSIVSECEKNIIEAIIRYVNRIGLDIDEDSINLYEKKLQLKTTVNKLIDIFQENADGDFSEYINTANLENFLKGYLNYMNEMEHNYVRVDLDVYGDFDYENMNEHVLHEL